MEDSAFNRDIYLQKKFIDIKKFFDIDTVIETGTYQGNTTLWLSKNFKTVYTIECNAQYFNDAFSKIGQVPNIKMELGESPKFLQNVLPSIDENKTIIFLDAHWYSNPVLKELNAIKDSGKKPIIAIHDFMVPGHPELGYDVYPNQNIVYNWEWIENYINNIYGKNGYTKEYNSKATGAMRGCVFIYPQKN